MSVPTLTMRRRSRPPGSACAVYVPVIGASMRPSPVVVASSCEHGESPQAASRTRTNSIRAIELQSRQCHETARIALALVPGTEYRADTRTRGRPICAIAAEAQRTDEEADVARAGKERVFV